MAFDLHTHTVCSDGRLTPAELVSEAVAAGLADGLALTDHDTIEGWEEAAAACEQHGLRFVPGIELSAEEPDGASVHVLGYWVDPAHVGLADECARLRRERDRRAAATIDRLAALGVMISVERVRALAGAAPIGRPHLADALVEVGAVPDRATAFDRWLGEGRAAYEPKQALLPERAVALIHAAGGAAVLAHPGYIGVRGEAEVGEVAAPAQRVLLDRLVAADLDGVEADHLGHPPALRRDWRRLAGDRGVLVTGGSDFHGLAEDHPPGTGATSDDVVDALAARAHARHRSGVL